MGVITTDAPPCLAVLINNAKLDVAFSIIGSHNTGCKVPSDDVFS